MSAKRTRRPRIRREPDLFRLTNHARPVDVTECPTGEQTRIEADTDDNRRVHASRQTRLAIGDPRYVQESPINRRNRPRVPVPASWAGVYSG